MKKLSELTYGMLDCDGVVMTVQDVKSKVKCGEVVNELFIMTNDWTEEILKKSYKEHQQGICSNVLSAPNNGERVLVDICNFCGEIINVKKYKRDKSGKISCFRCWSKGEGR